MSKLNVEINLNGKWQTACNIDFDNELKSTYSQTTLDYDLNYFYKYNDNPIADVSLRSKLDILPQRKNHWPSILLDMMPQGFARKIVCHREEIVDNQENDFQILKHGSSNPIGNLRIKSENFCELPKKLIGFKKEDLVDKNEYFLEHAYQMGAVVSGLSGAQGVAPKFLVNLCSDGLWYCDHSDVSRDIVQSYIVKMPRGKTEDDKLILKLEQKYMRVAKKLGLRVFDDLDYQNNILFIPRFDRTYLENKLLRIGVESMSSALGHYKFGESEFIENYLDILMKNSISAKQDVLEMVERDFINIVMGNTDNHSRNTAILRNEKGVSLSPLYDFAPMVLDPEGIIRSTRWKEESFSIPNFDYIYDYLISIGFQKIEVLNFYKLLIDKIENIKALLLNEKIEIDTIDRITKKHEEFLEKFKITFYNKK